MTDSKPVCSNGQKALEKLRNCSERNEYEFWKEVEDSLRSSQVAALKAAASRIGVETDGDKQDLAERLVEENVFLGPIGDENLYQITDDGVVRIGDRRSLAGQRRWS